jgi:hypothetical protein
MSASPPREVPFRHGLTGRYRGPHYRTELLAHVHAYMLPALRRCVEDPDVSAPRTWPVQKAAAGTLSAVRALLDHVGAFLLEARNTSQTGATFCGRWFE